MFASPQPITSPGISHLRHGLLPGVLPAGAHGADAHAMVGVTQADDVPVAGVQAGQHERHVVGLTAAVYKVNHLM